MTLFVYICICVILSIVYCIYFSYYYFKKEDEYYYWHGIKTKRKRVVYLPKGGHIDRKDMESGVEYITPLGPPKDYTQEQWMRDELDKANRRIWGIGEFRKID